MSQKRCYNHFPIRKWGGIFYEQKLDDFITGTKSIEQSYQNK